MKGVNEIFTGKWFNKDKTCQCQFRKWEKLHQPFLAIYPEFPEGSYAEHMYVQDAVAFDLASPHSASFYEELPTKYSKVE